MSIYGKGHCDHSGPFDARLAIVGEAPGDGELNRDPPKPMVGWTGTFVNGALGGERRRDKTFVTNASRCKPPDKEKEGTRRERIAFYRDDLAVDFQKLTNARTLLLLGADALESVLGLRGIFDYHCSVFTRAEANAVRAACGDPYTLVPELPDRVSSIVVSLHPAFTTRGMSQFKPGVRVAIGRAQNWAYSDNPPTRPGPDCFELDPTPQRLKWFVNNAEWLVLDVETPKDNNNIITICSATFMGHTLVFPWTGEFIQIIREVLESDGWVKIGHNFNFDMRAFSRYGIEPVMPIRDTIDQSALLWPLFKQKDTEDAGSKKKKLGTPWLSLYSCCARVLPDVVNWKEPWSEATKAIYGASYSWVPDWAVERLYCGLDGIHTERLDWATQHLLKKEGML